jgi:GT2 family glycosyltransferase
MVTHVPCEKDRFEDQKSGKEKMISIIVSSYRPEQFAVFADNVKATIGDIPYEIIRIDNPGTTGIAAAYNSGAAKSNYPYLCFVHEDVLFKTQNWGQLAVDDFKQDEKRGLIGIAGSRYKPFVFSGLGSTWGNAGLRMNIIQRFKSGSKHLLSKSTDTNTEEVIVLDGCFLCTTAEVFSKVQFDAEHFKGFHCYDIDFSFAVSLQYKVVVVYDILLEHLSAGGFNKQWMKETFTLHKKWRDAFPRASGKLSRQDVYMQEAGAYYFFLGRVLQLGYGYPAFLKMNFSKKFIGLVGLKHWAWMQLKLPVNVLRHYIPAYKKASPKQALSV